MGCDIHLYTEQLKTVNNVTAWLNVDLYEVDYCANGETGFDICEQYRGRSYDLFAALADVRNYGHITPMSQPNGLPADCHATTRKQSEEYGIDGHSHSWCTLQELYDYQAANKTKTQSGFVDPETAKALDERGTLPESWCQGTNQPNYVKRTWTRNESPVDDLIEAIEPRFKNLCYRTYCDGPIPKEQAEKFRIVFFFDN